MPELPDVEGFRRYLSRFASGRCIRRVRVPDGDIVRNTTPQGLGRALSGRRLGDPERRGKWLLARTDGSTLLLHFGMTGLLQWRSEPKEPGPHDRLVLDLDGGALTYRAQRKLGGAWLAGEEADIEGITGPLGPDPGSLDLDALANLLKDRRGGIKAALMDQSLMAGMGNELSDEVLWHARIHPRRPAAELGDDDRRSLHDAIHEVLPTASRHGRIPERDDWLEGVRGDRDPRCPRCGERVRTEKVAGRTSYVCPRCQA